MICGISKKRLEPSLGTEITHTEAVVLRVLFEFAYHFRQVRLRTNRRTGDHARAARSHKSDDGPAVRAEPIFDTGIDDLETGGIPAVFEDEITGGDVSPMLAQPVLRTVLNAILASFHVRSQSILPP